MIIGTCPYCHKTFRKREHKYKFCSLTCANRFNLNGLASVSLPLKDTSLAEFVGICLGDGCVSKYQTGITLNKNADAEYIPHVMRLAKSLFPGAHVGIFRRSDKSVDVRISSRVVSDFLRDMGIIPHSKRVPTWIKTDQQFMKACLRGLFDTEGSISFKRYVSRKGVSVYPQLTFRNANIHLFKFVRDSLLGLGFKPTRTLRRSLYLSNQQSLDKFRREIGFGNPKLLKRSIQQKV